MGEKPQEEWQPSGNFGLDTADMMHIHQDMMSNPDIEQTIKTPEEEQLEHKAIEYHYLTEIFGSALEALEKEETIGGVGLLSSSGISQSLARSINSIVKELPDETVMRVMEEARKATGNEAPSINRKTEEDSLTRTIGRGIGTAGAVMSAYFKMITAHYGEDNLYQIGKSKKSLNTLLRMTNAWSLNEFSETGFRDLGGQVDTYAGTGAGLPIMVEEYFTFTDEGPVVKDEYRTFFTSDDPSRVGCPAGHAVGVERHDAEVAVVIPVVEIAKILLDKWQKERQRAQ